MDNAGFQPDNDEKPDSTKVNEKLNNNNNGLPNGTFVDSSGTVPTLFPPETTTSDGTVRMKRQISLIGGIAVIVGTMIGSGIFITPAGLIERTDSAATSLVVWAGCGVLATLTALSYCELGTVVQRSGGEHAYFMQAFGSLHSFFGEIPAFLFAWMTAFLLKPSSLAALSLAVGKYIILPFIRFTDVCDWWDTQFDYQVGEKLLAGFCILTVTGINIFSAKVTERLLIVLTFAKLLACIIVIGIGIYNLSRGELGGLPTNGYDTSNKSFGDIGLSFYSGLWAYDGWNNLNFLTEELINPSRNLPLAILIAIPLVTVIYVFMNVSYLTMMTKEELIDSAAVGIDVGEKYLGPMKLLMPILVLLSVFGTANGSQLTAGRISYVAARDNHLPSVLSYVHVTRLTPIISLILNAVIAMIMVLYNDISKLIDTFNFTSWLIYGIAMIALFVLRVRQPDTPRPIRIPLFIPALALIIAGYIVVAPIIDQPSFDYLVPLGYYVIGLIFYYFFVYRKVESEIMVKITRTIQCIMYAAPSPYKED